MKNTRLLAFATALMMMTPLPAYASSGAQGSKSTPPAQSTRQIYLVGESHGEKKILDKELELWNGYYHDENMRHLFVENPYYTAEFLNLWMKSDNDDILDAMYADWEGTASYKPVVKDFYRQIKSQCPETIFHGTDVGHQRDTIGARFLKYLEGKKLEGSEQYRLAQEAIEQGKTYYENSDNIYRENMMAENFAREFDKLGSGNIMGIYGAAHTALDAMEYTTQSIPCMANQLKARYGDNIHSVDLAWMARDIDPLRLDTIKVGGKDYSASYFGKENLTGFKDLVSREFWRLEGAYGDFLGKPKTGDMLPYDNYLMLIETGQVFVIDYTKTDGSVARMYYRSDGQEWGGKPTTEEFTVG